VSPGPVSAIQRRRVAMGLAASGPLPTPTIENGDDPYGNLSPDPEWLAIDWREHLRTVELRGSRINYVDIGTGDGEPIVFIHGLGGSWQNFLENIPHFSHERRVVALDLPGFGASEMPDWEISIPDYGRFLHEFCAELDLTPAVLVGNSMGGLIATEATIEEPDDVAKLVLVSSVGISNVRLQREPVEAIARVLAAASPFFFRFREASMRRPGLRHVAFRQIFAHPTRLRPELLWEQYNGATDDSGTLTAGFAPAMVALAGYDFTDRLEQIAAPSLIVWGRDDHVVPPQDAPEFERHLSRSRLVVFDDCGHLPQLERPVRFNRLLDEFLAE
jgi:pimeloyl-ACP methyl ester carboxylesterase